MSTPFIPPVVLASDTVDLQSGFFSRLGDATLKGIPTAAISGALSVYNTFLDYSGKEAVDTARAIRGYSSSLGNYYDENKETIDFAGFVGTAFVPGTLGIKALRLAQSGTALGPVSRALGLTASRKDQYLVEAMKELGRSGGSITAGVKRARRAQLAWGTADNVMMTIAAELAIVATMNDSPTFEGDDLGDFAWNMAIGALVGGAVGGVLEGLATRGVLKSAQKQIEAHRRMFDTVSNPIKMGLSKADEVLLMTESIVKLPDDFFNTNVRYRLDGKTKTAVIDTTEGFKGVRTTAERTALSNLALKFNELTEGAEQTGQALFRFISDKIKLAREQGKSPDFIAEEVQGYLQGIKAVRALKADAAIGPPPKQFFINQKPTTLTDLFSDVRDKNTGKQAYYLRTNDPSKIKFDHVTRLGLANAEEAFDLGYDAVLTAAGKVAVNPKSAVISKTPDFALNNKIFLDLPTGSLTSEAVITGADLMKRSDDFFVRGRTVHIGKNKWEMEDAPVKEIGGSALSASVRFMWASRLDDAFFNKRTIQWDDFALLDRAASLPAKYRDSDLVTIALPDGRTVTLADIIDLGRYSNELKLQWLQDQLGKAVTVEQGVVTKVNSYDIRHIASHVNQSREWVEEAITSNFQPSKQLLGQRQDLGTYFHPKIVQMEWDLDIKQVAQEHAGPVGPGHFSTVVLSHHYAKVIRENELDNAFRAFMGADADRFPDAAEDLAQLVSEQGTGARTFGASNAGYGQTAELYMQETGKQVALVSQARRDAAIGAITPAVNAIRDNLDAAGELSILTTALRRDARKYYLAEDALDGTRRLVDREAVKLVEAGSFADLDEAIDYLRAQSTKDMPIRGSYDIMNQETADFFRMSKQLNAERVGQKTVLLNASGIARELDPEVIYAPPVDTRRYPFFAFVRAKERLGAPTDLAMITAKSDDQLRQLAARVGEDYEVIFKDDTKNFFKAKGQYDYSQAINESRVNSDLQKRGILGDFFPETRAQNILEDYVRWHANASDDLVRLAVQVKNRELFSKLEFLSQQFQLASTSTVRGAAILRSKIADPFQDYIKTALNISKQSEYPLLTSLNEFVDGAGQKMYTQLDNLWQTFRNSKGKDFISLQRANELMEQNGLGTPYKTMEEYLVANEKYPRNLIKDTFQKVNTWLATTVLRLDFANSLINIISMPIMLGTEMASIRNLAKNDPDLVGKLAELMTVKVPGEQLRVPSTARLIFNAVGNFHGKNKLALIQRYRDNGDITEVARLYHEVFDALAYVPNRKVDAWNKTVNAAVEKGAKITGNTFSEEFTRFIAADVMRQLTDPLVEAGKMTIKEQNAYMSVFVNRVHGNYVASQRPIIFQGTTGAAIGLFQTYAFNVLQQLFRHVENADKKAVLVFAGLQSSIYGMNGLPFFDAINTHLIGRAAGNPERKDAYSFLPQMDPEIGQWMLYGTASAFPLFGEKTPALYSRGDINPRHLSIIPINPLDTPAVSASIKLAKSIHNFGKQVSKGADMSTAMLQALEHHGWNRPLAGFAQVLAGQTTTGRGSLISAANDLETTSLIAKVQDRMVDFGGISRLLGARPMDEAVALHTMYRNKAYEAMDRARIEALGQAVKTKLSRNQMPTDDEMDDFMQSYVNAGGRIENFSSSLQRWMKDANYSVVNQMAAKVSSPYGRRLQELMGGEPLEDYRTME